jgi:hypothetical protein
MSPSSAKRMNELARMTPAERDESLVREMMGPLFDSFFGGTPKPQTPNPDNLPAGCPGCKETLDGQLVCCQERA